MRHYLSMEGIRRVGGDRVEAIDDLKRPTTVKELRLIQRMKTFVRKILPYLATTMVKPLVAFSCVKKSPDGRRYELFEDLYKKLLTYAPVLQFRDVKSPNAVHVDASDLAIIAFFSYTKV